MKYKDLFDKYIRPVKPGPTGVKPGGSLRHPLAAVIFDVYGTLFASGSGDITADPAKVEKKRAIERLLWSHSIRLDSETVLSRLYSEIKKEHAEGQSRGIKCPEVRIHRIWMKITGTDDRETARRLALGYELIVNPPYPMPYLKNLLAACRTAGLEMGIISNAQFYTPLLFPYFFGKKPRELGFAPDLLIYSYVSGRAKPCKDMFERAAQRLEVRGIAPGSVLYAGNDMLNDIYPAAKAGFQTALFAGDRRPLNLRKDDPRYADLIADLTVDSLAGLAEVIENPELFFLAGRDHQDRNL
ncbi:MAG: HAD family hydrolase [Desulfobacteraceae bacterium]|nr:HAD family hydrolase [Desulfobacteraceae bacterium]